MSHLNKTITLPHLDGVELEDWDFLPNVIADGMQAAGMRADSGESVVFAQQLQHMRAQILNRPYPKKSAKNMIPQQHESSVGAKEFAYRIADQTGIFDLITNYADDLPVTNVKGEKKIADIHSFGGSVQYDIFEIQQATMAGMPLVAREMEANRDIAERKFEKIAWVGDEKSGAHGMTTHPNITKETAATKTAGGTTWANNATAQEVYNDMVRPIIQQTEDTNEVERPDTMILSLSDIEYANSTFFDDASGQSALARFKQNYPDVTVESSAYMKGIGAGDTNVILAYRNDKTKVAMETPVPYTVMPPQQRNLATIVNAHMRTAGVIAYFPLSITVIEGL